MSVVAEPRYLSPTRPYIRMAKGQQLLQLLFVALVVTAAFAAFFTLWLRGGINESVRQSIEVQGREVASVINLLAASPPGTTYTINLALKISVTRCALAVRRNGIALDIVQDGRAERFFIGTLANVAATGAPEHDCRAVIPVRRTDAGVVVG